MCLWSRIWSGNCLQRDPLRASSRMSLTQATSSWCWVARNGEEKDSEGPGGPQLASPASPWAGHLSSVNDRRLVGVEGSRRQKQHRGSHGRSVKIRTKETQTDPNRTRGDQNHSRTGSGPAQVAWDGAGSPGGGAPRVHGFGNRTAGHSSKTQRGDTESLPLNPKSGQGAVDPGPQESGLRSGSHIGARSLWG